MERSSRLIAMELREAAAGSPEYRELLALRFDELRRPLGLTWTAGEMKADEGDRHFGLHDGLAWLGTVVACDLGGGVVKLRQIAVISGRQGEGLGRRLMALVEECLQAEGAREFQLHARLSVAGFYEATGYRPVGEVFEEIALPHVKMRKVLTGG